MTNDTRCIVVTNNNRSRFKNIYRSVEDHYELEITDDETSNIIIIDKNIVDRMKHHFWHLDNTGRKGYKKPQVYYYKSKKKYYLNRFVLNTNDKNIRILFKNRNPYDFRKDNLHITTVGGKEVRDCNLHNENGMTNIFTVRRKDGSIRLFHVIYKNEQGEKHSKSFNTTKLGFNDALRKAQEFRDSLI